MIPGFNTIFNSANSIMSLTAAASAFTPSLLSTENDSRVSPLLAIGSLAYLIGLLTEASSEQQRKAFKNDPKNAGKPFSGGLFGLARHQLWRIHRLERRICACVWRMDMGNIRYRFLCKGFYR